MKESNKKASRRTENAALPGKKASSADLRDFQKKLLSAIMIVNTNDMSSRMLDTDTKVVFRYMNDFVSRVIPVIEDNGGEVDKISEAGLMALFPSDVKSALICAVTVCQKLSTDPGFEMDFSQFAVAICFGYIMSGIVGDGKTFTNITLSEYTGLAQYLQQKASGYGCHIVISGSCAAQIPEFESRFHSRYIGNVFLRRSGTYEKLYDVFDGDTMEQRNNKMKSRMIFERAVKEFDKRNYPEARAYFIEVLKADRFDLMAKEYLYLCDKCQAAADDAGRQDYLESWG